MSSTSMRRVRDIVSIKRTIWSNFDKFRTLGVFYLERNEVLDLITKMSDEEIAKIADECREGGVRWRSFTKYLSKIESALIGGREIIDLTKEEARAIDTIDGKSAQEFFTVHEKADGVAISFNVNGKFDVLAKGNRNGCFNVRALNITPESEFTLVNELLPFWEDRYSLAIKSDSVSVAIATEDPKLGKKGSACVRIYVIEGDKIRIDHLGKYIDTSSMLLWINP